MFSALRTRFGIPGVLATVALVFAMTGGAFAAKYLITSTKQISPSVLKKLKGATGPAGAPGAAGAQGAAGSNGKDGANGTNGTNGVSVASSVEPKGANCTEGGSKFVAASGTTYACNGAKGAKGAEGSPWTELGTLPPEETETGVWAANGTTSDLAGVWAPISFNIPLSAPLGASGVHFEGEGEAVFKATCTGTMANPTAPPGHLCVYGAANNLKPGFLGAILDPSTTSPGAAVSGAALSLSVVGDPGFGAGTWAVTAAP